MKSNIEKYVELQIDIIKYNSYLDGIEYCNEKYKDSKLFNLCLSKHIDKTININWDTAYTK